ncbi:hypothetical protein SNEBB_003992 [Seison nebaliae]|nr:hypothetical protein SNEBB_003992 [Seison nebaliae]
MTDKSEDINETLLYPDFWKWSSDRTYEKMFLWKVEMKYLCAKNKNLRNQLCYSWKNEKVLDYKNLSTYPKELPNNYIEQYLSMSNETKFEILDNFERMLQFDDIPLPCVNTIFSWILIILSPQIYRDSDYAHEPLKSITNIICKCLTIYNDIGLNYISCLSNDYDIILLLRQLHMVKCRSNILQLFRSVCLLCELFAKYHHNVFIDLPNEKSPLKDVPMEYKSIYQKLEKLLKFSISEVLECLEEDNQSTNFTILPIFTLFPSLLISYFIPNTSHVVGFQLKPFQTFVHTYFPSYEIGRLCQLITEDKNNEIFLRSKEKTDSKNVTSQEKKKDEIYISDEKKRTKFRYWLINCLITKMKFNDDHLPLLMDCLLNDYLKIENCLRNFDKLFDEKENEFFFKKNYLSKIQTNFQFVYRCMLKMNRKILWKYKNPIFRMFVVSLKISPHSRNDKVMNNICRSRDLRMRRKEMMNLVCLQFLDVDKIDRSCLQFLFKFVNHCLHGIELREITKELLIPIVEKVNKIVLSKIVALELYKEFIEMKSNSPVLCLLKPFDKHTEMHQFIQDLTDKNDPFKIMGMTTDFHLNINFMNAPHMTTEGECHKVRYLKFLQNETEKSRKDGRKQTTNEFLFFEEIKNREIASDQFREIMDEERMNYDSFEMKEFGYSIRTILAKASLNVYYRNLSIHIINNSPADILYPLIRMNDYSGFMFLFLVRLLTHSPITSKILHQIPLFQWLENEVTRLKNFWKIPEDYFNKIRIAIRHAQSNNFLNDINNLVENVMTNKYFPLPFSSHDFLRLMEMTFIHKTLKEEILIEILRRTDFPKHKWINRCISFHYFKFLLEAKPIIKQFFNVNKSEMEKIKKYEETRKKFTATIDVLPTYFKHKGDEDVHEKLSKVRQQIIIKRRKLAQEKSLNLNNRTDEELEELKKEERKLKDESKYTPLSNEYDYEEFETIMELMKKRNIPYVIKENLFDYLLSSTVQINYSSYQFNHIDLFPRMQMLWNLGILLDRNSDDFRLLIDFAIFIDDEDDSIEQDDVDIEVLMENNKFLKMRNTYLILHQLLDHIGNSTLTQLFLKYLIHYRYDAMSNNMILIFFELIIDSLIKKFCSNSKGLCIKWMMIIFGENVHELNSNEIKRFPSLISKINQWLYTGQISFRVFKSTMESMIKLSILLNEPTLAIELKNSLQFKSDCFRLEYNEYMMANNPHLRDQIVESTYEEKELFLKFDQFTTFCPDDNIFNIGNWNLLSLVANDYNYQNEKDPSKDELTNNFNNLCTNQYMVEDFTNILQFPQSEMSLEQLFNREIMGENDLEKRLVANWMRLLWTEENCRLDKVYSDRPSIPVSSCSPFDYWPSIFDDEINKIVKYSSICYKEALTVSNYKRSDINLCLDENDSNDTYVLSKDGVEKINCDYVQKLMGIKKEDSLENFEMSIRELNEINSKNQKPILIEELKRESNIIHANNNYDKFANYFYNIKESRSVSNSSNIQIHHLSHMDFNEKEIIHSFLLALQYRISTPSIIRFIDIWLSNMESLSKLVESFLNLLCMSNFNKYIHLILEKYLCLEMMSDETMNIMKRFIVLYFMSENRSVLFQYARYYHNNHQRFRDLIHSLPNWEELVKEFLILRNAYELLKKECCGISKTISDSTIYSFVDGNVKSAIKIEITKNNLIGYIHETGKQYWQNISGDGESNWRVRRIQESAIDYLGENIKRFHIEKFPCILIDENVLVETVNRNQISALSMMMEDEMDKEMIRNQLILFRRSPDKIEAINKIYSNNLPILNKLLHNRFNHLNILGCVRRNFTNSYSVVSQLDYIFNDSPKYLSQFQLNRTDFKVSSLSSSNSFNLEGKYEDDDGNFKEAIVPFRLTREITSLFGYVGSNGLFLSTSQRIQKLMKMTNAFELLIQLSHLFNRRAEEYPSIKDRHLKIYFDNLHKCLTSPDSNLIELFAKAKDKRQLAQMSYMYCPFL